MANRLHYHSARVHKAFAAGEHWTHAAYCAVLFVEGHGTYAMIGGVLGVFVVINLICGGADE